MSYGYARNGARNIKDEPEAVCSTRKQKSAQKNKNKKPHNDEIISEGHWSQLKELQWPRLEQSEQQNKVVLDYNLKYKINIHQSIMI